MLALRTGADVASITAPSFTERDDALDIRDVLSEQGNCALAYNNLHDHFLLVKEELSNDVQSSAIGAIPGVKIRVVAPAVGGGFGAKLNVNPDEILAVTLAGIGLGVSKFGGIVSMPPSLAPTFLQLDIKGALEIGLVSVIFAFLFVDLFDNIGTLVAVTKRAGLIDKAGRIPGLNRILITDAAATIVGSVAGTSTVTSYVESAAGVQAGVHGWVCVARVASSKSQPP